MSATNQNRLAKGMRWAAQVIGLGATVFLLLTMALIIYWQHQAQAAVMIPATGLNLTLPQPPPPGQCTLQVVVEPPNSGSVLVEPVKPFYDYGELVWLTAQPSANVVFWHWSEDWNEEKGILLGYDNPTGYMVTASRKITAHFVRQGQVLPSPPPPEWQWPSLSWPPSLPSLDIWVIIPFAIILGAVILTVVFIRRPLSATSRQNLAKGMRWVARLIGLGITAFFFLALFISLMWRNIGGSDILALASLGIGLVGWIVSWWREWLAGVLMILACLVLGSGLGLSGQWRVSDMDWSRLGLPYLVAGVLFLLSWWLSSKTSSSASAMKL